MIPARHRALSGVHPSAIGRREECKMTDKTSRIAIPGSNRPAVEHAKLLGKADGTKRIRVSIYARPNPAGVGKVTAASKSNFATELPGKRRYLTEDQFAATYGADPADLERIASWAG